MSQNQRNILIFLFFVAVSAVYTYPLFFLGPGLVYGMHEDIARSLHFFWCLQRNGDWLYANHHWPQLNAPFGWDVPNTPQYLYWWCGAALSRWWDVLAPTNILIAASFPLSGFFMYLLAFEMTGSMAGSLLAGFLFAFSPWHFAKAEAYPAIAGTQWVVLYGWTLLRYLKAPGWRRAWAAGGALLIVVNSSLVLGFLACIATAFLMALRWTVRRLRERSWALRTWNESLQLFVTSLPAFSGMALYLLTRDLPRQGVELLRRAPEPVNLKLGTVGLIHFFLPTYYHPWWGAKVLGLMTALKPMTWVLEDIVNPGYTAWILGLAGLGFVLCNHRMKDRGFWLAVSGLAAFSILLCLDPYIGNKLLPLPNTLFYILYPAFRNFSRFALPFSLCMSLLAAFGFNALASRMKVRKPWALLAVMLSVAAFELYCPTRPRVYDASLVPEEVQWLALQSVPGIAAEYPVITERYKYEPLYLTWQMHHGHPLVNGDYQDLSANAAFRYRIKDYRSPGTIRYLRGLGVRYVVVHEYLDLRDRHPEREGTPLRTSERLPARIGPAVKVFENPFASVFEIPPP